MIPRGMKLGKGGWAHVAGEDWPSRWESVGGKFYGMGRMIARKDDPIWERLGSSETFPDALDTALPPFAFNSGYGWREIDRAEAIKLGVIGERTEVSPQDHQLNDGLKSTAIFDQDYLRAVKADLEQMLRDTRAQKEAKPKAKMRAGTFTAPKFTEFELPDGTRIMANAGFDPLELRGGSGRWVKIMHAADKGGGSGTAWNADEEIERGLVAMQKVLDTKQDVLNAMYRPGIGSIDFIWGSPSGGIRHILEKRNREGRQQISLAGQQGKDVLSKLIEVIAKGEVGRTYIHGSHKKRDIDFEGYKAVLQLDRDGNYKTWLLSGFKKT